MKVKLKKKEVKLLVELLTAKEGTGDETDQLVDSILIKLKQLPHDHAEDM